MGVSLSSPNSHFPFGTCGVSLQGSSCETETKGASPLGTLAPQLCLRTAHPSLPGTRCQGDTKSWKLLESCREENGNWTQGMLVQSGVCCRAPRGSSSSTTSDVCRGRGPRDDKDRDWFGLLHSHPTPHHGAHSPWSPLNSVHCPAHCPSPHE